MCIVSFRTFRVSYATQLLNSTKDGYKKYYNKSTNKSSNASTKCRSGMNNFALL